MKVGIISLGCPKNLVDTEVMLGHLAAAGHEITTAEPATGAPAATDAIIINTCCFIAPARAEAAQAVREALELKRRGACRFVIIAGCWPQREAARPVRRLRLLREFPGVDALVGVNDFPHIASILEELARRQPVHVGRACLSPPGIAAGIGIPALHENAVRRLREAAAPASPSPGPPLLRLSSPEYLYGEGTPRLLATPPWTAYLKIAEGCDHRCAFCIIPQLRGRFRSRPLESVTAEAQSLARRGVREFNLIAQDTTCYGRDLYGAPRICNLLRELARIAGVRWLRLMYCYPTGVNEELISLFRDEPKLCKYIDLPLQHGAREILRAMRRPGSPQSYLELIARLRREIPGIALRTSILVGFPGEKEKHFEALLGFLAAAKFDRAGAFVYSREEGTPAAKLPEQVPPEVAQRRYQRVMELQQRISLERNREWVGKRMEVLVETRAQAPFAWAGRSHRDAPESDGLVYLALPAHRSQPGHRSAQPAHRPAARPQPGDFVIARIAAAREYDLEGEM